MKNIINFRLSCLLFALAISAIVVSGCSTSKPTPAPLAGWKVYYNHEPDQAIVKDYQNYIEMLSPEEKKFAGIGQYYEDGAGQHAVEIQIPLNGTWRFHILIYDKDDKRIKVVKYSPGKYRS